MPMHALKGETYQSNSPLRIAILPMPGHTYFPGETEFLMFRQFARDVRDWYGVFSYILLPESAKKQIRPEPGIRLIFEGPFECFHDGIVQTPTTFLELFNPRDGKYPVDLVITSRGTSGATLQRALRDYRSDVIPLVLSESTADGIPLILDESMPADFGWKANPSLDWSELTSRVCAYATAAHTYFDTERERQVALNSARRVLSARMLKNLDAKMEVMPYGFSTDFVDECTEGVKQRDKFTVFMGSRHNCLVAGSRVIKNGLPTPIENICSDDVVRADFGVTRVTNVHRYATIALVRVKATYLLPLVCTPDHQVMITPYEIKTTYERQKKGVFTDFRSSRVFGDPGWLTVEEIERAHAERRRGTRHRRKGLMVHYPFDETEVDDPGISDDLCELLGWYVAEGSCPVSSYKGRRYQVSFALSRDERDVAQRLLHLAKNLFGANGRIRERADAVRTIKGRTAKFTGGIEVVVCSRKMAEIITALIPGHATTKTLSEKLMRLPRRKQQLILSGELAGDGYFMGITTKAGNQFHYADYRTASRDLAVQLQLLLLRQHRISGIYFRDGMYSVRDQTGDRQHGFIDSGVLYCPVKKVTREDGPRNVYDLTTECGNYVTESGLVHNCDKRWDRILDIYNRFYAFGRDIGIVITAPKLESVSTFPIIQSNEAIEVMFECEQPAFLRKAAECHVALWMSKVEGLTVGLLQQAYCGLILILPRKADWVKEILRDKYADYPFLFTRDKEAEKRLRWIYENYDEAKEMVAWMPQWIKDTYGTHVCTRKVYESMRDTVITPKAPCRLWTKSNVELFLATAEALPDVFTFEEAVDKCYTMSQQLYKGMRDPRRGKPSRWSLWKWFKGPGGYLDTCRAEYPVFKKDSSHVPGPYSDMQYFKYREEHVCPKCGGRGFLDKAREAETRCPQCDGSGEMKVDEVVW